MIVQGTIDFVPASISWHFPLVHLEGIVDFFIIVVREHQIRATRLASAVQCSRNA